MALWRSDTTERRARPVYIPELAHEILPAADRGGRAVDAALDTGDAFGAKEGRPTDAYPAIHRTPERTRKRAPDESCPDRNRAR